MIKILKVYFILIDIYIMFKILMTIKNAARKYECFDKDKKKN